MNVLTKTDSNLGRGYVQGIGPMHAEIAIVGQSVGKYEIESGIPFSGPAGDLLDESLAKAGLKRRDIYFTNVLKYQPIKELKIQQWADFESVERLWEELDKVNPSKIIALGSVPLYFLTGKTGIKNWRGSILRTQRLNKIIVSTYNTAHFLYQKGGEVEGYWQKHLVDFDIKRAKNLSTSWQPPHRYLHIAKSSRDVHSFFERHANYKIASCDIETLKTIPGCISFAFTSREAMSIPLFQQLDGVQICTIPKLDLVEIWRILDKIFREKEIDGQNFKFDQDRLENELPFKIHKFRSDTMLKAAVLNPELPKSQAFLASILTEEPYYKDEGKDFNPRRDKIDVWLLYNAKDSAVNKEISEVQDNDLKDEGLYDYYYNYFHKLHDFYYEMEHIGLDVDEEQRKKLIEKYEDMLDVVEDRLAKVLGWIPNVNSVKDVALVCQEDLKLPKRDSYDEDTLVSLLANNAKREDQRVVLQGIIDGRRLRKILGPDRLRFRVDWDGKAKTQFRITGTETGRSSTAILKQPVRLGKIGLSFQTMSKHGDVGHDFRSMFIPPKGMVFINVDQSQAEARIVALLSNDFDLLELFDVVDIHRFTAAIGADLAITRRANSARKAIELQAEVNEAIRHISFEERFVGKGNRHAGNYDMGKHKFMLKTNTDARRFHIDINISEWKAGKLLDRFHAFSPNIRGVFHRDIREVINNTRELRRPDGSIRMFFDRLGPDLYREAFADMPQHTVAWRTKTAALKLRHEVPGIQIVNEAHDALLMQWWEKEAEIVAKLASKFISEPIDFSNCSLPRGTLIIPSDIEIGYNYAELKKVKWAT